jgi:hypothetical protein
MILNEISKVKINNVQARNIALFFCDMIPDSRKNLFNQFLVPINENNVQEAEREKLRDILFHNLVEIRRYVVPTILDQLNELYTNNAFPAENPGMHDSLVYCHTNEDGTSETLFLDLEGDVQRIFDLNLFDKLPFNIMQTVIDYKNGDQFPAGYDEEDYYKEFPRKFPLIDFTLADSPKTLQELKERGLISEVTVLPPYKEAYPEVWEELHEFEKN